MAKRTAKAPTPADARLVALQVIQQVVDSGHSLSTLLPENLPRLEEGDRALCQAICYGVVRHYPSQEALLKRLLAKPFKRRDRDLHALLHVALFQLAHMRTPEHAAVSTAVEVTRKLDKGWARGVVNAVLRRFLRERTSLQAAIADSPEAQHDHPHWLLQRMQQAWPEQWPSMVAANNRHPPMTLRVNRNRTSRSNYLDQLRQAGIAAIATTHAPDGVILEVPVSAERLPGLAAGEVSVQDEAAQLAAVLLAPQTGERLLDACAAPGGKSGHLLESCPDCALTAVDLEPSRLLRVNENLVRLGFEARVIAGDAAEPEDWWEGELFDRILLDAPCSATGVIRRHPDIKLLRRDDDIGKLVTLQRRILNALWPLLRPGGQLLYATCSILPEENSLQVAKFLADREDAVERSLDVAWGRQAPVGRQILPGEDGMDGFYYALLEKH